MERSPSELDFIEACHAPASDAEWASKVCDASGVFVGRRAAALAYAYALHEEGTMHADTIHANAPGWEVVNGDHPHPLSILTRLNDSAAGRAFIRHRLGGGACGVFVASELPDALRSIIEPSLDIGGDGLAVMAACEPRSGFFLFARTACRVVANPRQRARWHALTVHLAAAQKVRALDAVALQQSTAAVFSADGRLEHADARSLDEAQRSTLSAAVRAMDTARCRRRKCSPEEALDHWRGLHAGQYSLVESTESGGRRRILAVRVVAVDPRALSAREAQVADLAARGLTNKLIAAELELGPSTVAVHLGAAMRKLGVRDRPTLVRWLRRQGSALDL